MNLSCITNLLNKEDRLEFSNIFSKLPDNLIDLIKILIVLNIKEIQLNESSSTYPLNWSNNETVNWSNNEIITW